jgi:hypothetical protein
VRSSTASYYESAFGADEPDDPEPLFAPESPPPDGFVSDEEVEGVEDDSLFDSPPPVFGFDEE